MNRTERGEKFLRRIFCNFGYLFRTTFLLQKLYCSWEKRWFCRPTLFIMLEEFLGNSTSTPISCECNNNAYSPEFHDQLLQYYSTKFNRTPFLLFPCPVYTVHCTHPNARSLITICIVFFYALTERIKRKSCYRITYFIRCVKISISPQFYVV